MTAQASNSSPSDAAVDVARRLLGREALPQADDALRIANAEQICARVADGLSRWLGPYGARALVGRALGRAQLDHPSLTGVALTAAQPPEIAGLVESARANGVGAVVEGTVAMLATLTDVISRLIGDDLAVKLVEQSITPSVGASFASTNGVPHPMKDQ